MSFTLHCSLVFLACVLTRSAAQTASCEGRCGGEYYRGYACQCDYSCLGYGECCRDYESQCTTKNSCKGRCGESFKRGRTCSCDPECVKYNQCCADYKNHCDEEANGGAAAQTSSSCNNVDSNASKDVPPTSFLQDDLGDDVYGEVFPDEGFSGPEDPSADDGPSAAAVDEVPAGTPLDAGAPESRTEAVPVLPRTDAAASTGEPTQPDAAAASTSQPTQPDAAAASTSQPTQPDAAASTASGEIPTESPESGDSANTPEWTTASPQTPPAAAGSTTQPPSVSAAASPQGGSGGADPEGPAWTEVPPAATTEKLDATPPDAVASAAAVETTPSQTTAASTPPSAPTSGATAIPPEQEASASASPSMPDPQDASASASPASVPSLTDVPQSGTAEDAKPAGASDDPPKVTLEPTSKPLEKPQKPQKPRPTKAAPGKTPSKPEGPPSVDDTRDYQSDDSNDTNLCSGRPISGVTTLRNGTMVVFRGHYFWVLQRDRVPGPARGITDVWGVPSPIDTVFTRCNCQGKTYIFKGGLYWRFENDVLDQGFPRVIATGFDGLRGHITAALSVPQQQRSGESVFFFKRGGLVQKYSYQFGTGPGCGRKTPFAAYSIHVRKTRQAVSFLAPPINIRTSWKGFPSMVTAAVSEPSAAEPTGYKYYVFSRTKSYTVRMSGERPVIAASRANVSNRGNGIFKCPPQV